MFVETLTRRDDVIGIICEGRLSADDMRRVHALLHERLATAGRPGLLVDLRDFEGFDEPAPPPALEPVAARRRDFRRIAVVGDRRSCGEALAGELSRAEVRWFASGEREAAAVWAADG